MNNNEVHIQMSQREFEERAFIFMRENYTAPKECRDEDERDRYYTRLGMLLDFISGMFHPLNGDRK